MNEEFSRKIAGGLAVTGALIIPPGLIICGILAGWKGFAGSLVGFAVVSLHTIASLSILKWATKKPAKLVPTIMMATMWGRLIVLAGVLYGLTFVKAFNTLSMLFSFLALFLAHSTVEILYAYRLFRTAVKGGDTGP